MMKQFSGMMGSGGKGPAGGMKALQGLMGKGMGMGKGKGKKGKGKGRKRFPF